MRRLIGYSLSGLSSFGNSPVDLLVRGLVYVKGFIARGGKVMRSLTSVLQSGLGALYNRGLRDVADRCVACVGGLIRVGLKSVVIGFLTKAGETMRSLVNFFGDLCTHCDVLTMITIAGLILMVASNYTLASAESISIRTNKDCVSSNVLPDHNNNGTTGLTIGQTGDYYYVSLVQFDISAIPSAATINSARLYLYCIMDQNMGQVKIMELAGPWSESDVTWNNMPYGNEDGAMAYISDVRTGWNYADVTEHIRAWHTGVRPNYGFQIRPPSFMDGQMAMFYPREAGINISYLVVEYTVSKPDLTPYRPAHWNDKIPIGINRLAGNLPHSYSGRYFDDQILYFNWASANIGDETASNYSIRVEVTDSDGAIHVALLTTEAKAYSFGTNDSQIGPLSAEDHTFKFWVDYDDNIDESNESNNYYERTITVWPRPPRPPTITITSPTTGTTYTTTGGTITIGGICEDQDGDLSRVRLYNYATKETKWDYRPDGSHSSFSFPGVSLKPGRNYVRVTVYDDRGLTGYDYITITRGVYTISGYVKDSYGNGIEGAGVYISGESSVTTDSMGYYRKSEIDPGPHTISVFKPGYGSASVSIDVQSNLSRNFILQARPTITITSPTTETTYTTAASTITIRGICEDKDGDLSKVKLYNYATRKTYWDYRPDGSRSSFSFRGVPLNPDRNYIRVTVHDDGGLTGSDYIFVTRIETKQATISKEFPGWRFNNFIIDLGVIVSEEDVVSLETWGKLGGENSKNLMRVRISEDKVRWRFVGYSRKVASGETSYRRWTSFSLNIDFRYIEIAPRGSPEGPYPNWIDMAKVTIEIYPTPSMVARLNLSIEGHHSEEEKPLEGVPEAFALFQNFPNPFNPATEIRYQLPESSDVRIVIYDLLGREVRRLVDEYVEAGYHSVVWDGRDGLGREVGSGVYLVRMAAKDFVGVRKMVKME